MLFRVNSKGVLNTKSSFSSAYQSGLSSGLAVMYDIANFCPFQHQLLLSEISNLHAKFYFWTQRYPTCMQNSIFGLREPSSSMEWTYCPLFTPDAIILLEILGDIKFIPCVEVNRSDYQPEPSSIIYCPKPKAEGNGDCQGLTISSITLNTGHDCFYYTESQSFTQLVISICLGPFKT